MYRVIYTFADLQDNGHVYNVGDVYPRDGYFPQEDRIKELVSSNNRLETPLIKVEKKNVETNTPIEEAKAEDKEEIVVKRRKKKAE